MKKVEEQEELFETVVVLLDGDGIDHIFKDYIFKHDNSDQILDFECSFYMCIVRELFNMYQTCDSCMIKMTKMQSTKLPMWYQYLFTCMMGCEDLD